MKYLKLPDGFPPQRLPFYLSMEEWAALNLKDVDDDIFFMWQVTPTVVFGRNQRIELELDLDYCNTHGIQYYRRKSGGGCVYADENNVFFSYITSADDVVTTFSKYTGMVAAFLRTLGLDAHNTSRNDVLIGDRKVSGNAFFHLPGRCIAHGTMLYDADMTHLSRAITPSRSKLESKGVKSVQSRVTTIKEHLPQLGIEEFKRKAKESLTDGVITLTEQQIDEIKAIEEGYYVPKWTFGNHKSASLTRDKRIEGVGEFHADIELQEGVIKRVNLSGDFFMLGDLDTMLLDSLKGIPLDRVALTKALEETETAKAIPGLSKEDFINMILGIEPQKNTI